MPNKPPADRSSDDHLSHEQSPKKTTEPSEPPAPKNNSSQRPLLLPLPEKGGYTKAWLPRSVKAESAWRIFVRTYEGFLRECARATFRTVAGTVCREEVEDAVQDVYIRLLSADCRALVTFRGTRERQVLAFLARTVENLVIDMTRRDATQKRGRLTPHRPLHMVPPDDDALCSSDLTPEERMLVLEECQVAICRAVPPGTRKIRRNLYLLRQSAIEGMTSKEIAEDWGEDLSPSAVDSALFRMRTRMKADPEGEIPLPGRALSGLRFCA